MRFAIGDTDCEAIHEGFLAQPVNALTSLGFIVAGLTLIVRGARKGRADGASELVYGSILVAIGLGSVAFHGPQPAGSQFVHDLPIAAALLYIVVHNVGRLNRIEGVHRWFGLGLIPLVAVFAVAPTVAQVVAGVLAAAAMLTEVMVYRSSGPGRIRRLDTVAATLLLVAGIGYFFGRTGSALCDPAGAFQLHGVWHLLSAAAFLVWGFAALHSSPNWPMVESDT